MFGDELKPIWQAAFRLLREQYETEIEDCRAEIATQERKIKKHKSLLAYFAKLEKELAKPPKPFKPVGLTKAQAKAYNAAAKAMRGGPNVRTVFIHPPRKV